MPWNYSVITSCLYCKRERIKPVPPFMFDIPEDRLCVDKKPFTNTGVDYVGPCHIKLSKKTDLIRPLLKDILLYLSA